MTNYIISYYGTSGDGYVSYENRPCNTIEEAMTFDTELEATEKRNELQKEWLSILKVEKVEFYLTWDDISCRCMSEQCSLNDIKVKDNARCYIGDYARDFGVDIEEVECPEEEIDSFLLEHPECDRFDEYGRMAIMIGGF